MNIDSNPTQASRPSWLLLGSEPFRAATEYLSHRLRRPLPPPLLQGDGHPVVIFPGLATDGVPVGPLVEHCRRLGYTAMDWGRGFNTGPGANLEDWLQVLAEELRNTLRSMSASAKLSAPTLIGWSLGGLYARELAKLPAFNVRQVITIGTPFNGSTLQTHAGWLYEKVNGNPAELSTALQRRLKRPPPVPTTSIYSRSDGIVAWQACRHETQGAQVQDIEVKGSHLGMGWNPAVMRLVADRLIQPQRGWQRYRSDA